MKWNKTWKYINTVRNFIFGYIEDIYSDVQPQDTQAHTVSLFEYANTVGSRCAMGALGSWWNTRICMEMNIRALNL